MHLLCAKISKEAERLHSGPLFSFKPRVALAIFVLCDLHGYHVGHLFKLAGITNTALMITHVHIP
jgi:hypothetical protein